jgi:hypothetical protein
MCESKTVYYYSEMGNETSFYEIIEYPNKIKNKYKISFPLGNSVYQYVTYFNDLFKASDYLMKQKNQIKN